MLTNEWETEKKKKKKKRKEKRKKKRKKKEKNKKTPRNIVKTNKSSRLFIIWFLIISCTIVCSCSPILPLDNWYHVAPTTIHLSYNYEHDTPFHKSIAIHLFSNHYQCPHKSLTFYTGGLSCWDPSTRDTLNRERQKFTQKSIIWFKLKHRQVKEGPICGTGTSFAIRRRFWSHGMSPSLWAQDLIFMLGPGCH